MRLLPVPLLKALGVRRSRRCAAQPENQRLHPLLFSKRDALGATPQPGCHQIADSFQAPRRFKAGPPTRNMDGMKMLLTSAYFASSNSHLALHSDRATR